MKGTKYEGNWIFYHDALSFLTAKETKKWMTETIFEDKSIISKWLIPINDVNKGTTYHNRPVGNSPECIPLDNCLNNDV